MSFAATGTDNHRSRRPTTENGIRVLSALAEFGTPMPEFAPERFTDPRTLLMLGRDPFRVDILTDIPGIEFAAAWGRRTSVTFNGQPIPLIAVENLIANKTAVGHLQDQADVEALQSIRGKRT